MALLAISLPAAATEASPDTNTIVRKVDAATRLSRGTQIANLEFSTWRYSLRDGGERCSKHARQLLAENIRRIQSEGEGCESMAIMITREPATDRCRIIAAHEEGGSVFGTEFSVESTRNPVARKAHEYTYSPLRKDQYQDRAIGVIEMAAAPDRTRRTNLEKGVAWVDKALFRVLKDEYQPNGRIESGLQWIDGVAVMTGVEINN